MSTTEAEREARAEFAEVMRLANALDASLCGHEIAVVLAALGETMARCLAAADQRQAFAELVDKLEPIARKRRREGMT
jgi:hypothetical protein